MGKAKRDSDYYMRRLEIEHPSIFADWRAGRYPSARKALEAAGLRSPTKALGALKNAWAKATIVEKKEFVQWIRSARPAAPGGLLDPHGRLLAATAARIKKIMKQRGIKMGAIMAEMGFTPLDPSLGNALSVGRPTRVRPDLAKKLEKWIEDNRHVV